MSPELERIAHQLRVQDNAGTHSPIFMVQRHRRTYGFDPAYSNKAVYVDEEHHEVDFTTYDEYECPSCGERLGLADMDDECCTHCGKGLDLGDYCLTRTAYQDTWENVQPFFTREGAENYLRVNGHNIKGLEEPRIYVASASRNAEWEALRQALLNHALDNR